MIIKEVFAKFIFDSRKEKTISVLIKTNIGNFSASAPNGKSTGKNAVKIYKENLEGDINTLKKFKGYFLGENLERFDDLQKIEDIVNKHIGANTLFALESAILKAISKEQKKQIWELINPNSKKFPRLVGNCIGGGSHSSSNKKPDFQEFLLVPNLKSIKKNFEKNINAKIKTKEFLKKYDENFEGKITDENAWMTSLNEKQVLEILKKNEILMGIDIAASGFYKRKKYLYKNPLLTRTSKEQFSYLANLIKNFNLFYIEDPFQEEDFENFAKLLKKFPNRLIVGDDLIVTNSKRLKKAIEMKSVNAIIVKPNQCGSLLEVKKVCGLAKKNEIQIIFSHRSGETEENILADLAFGFSADFFKCGINGKVREIKLKRLLEIEKKLKLKNKF
jgi:enolase